MEHLALLLIATLHDAGYPLAWVHVEGSINSSQEFKGAIYAGSGAIDDLLEFNEVAQAAWNLILAENNVIVG
jgi:hypothetical protein